MRIVESPEELRLIQYRYPVGSQGYVRIALLLQVIEQPGWGAHRHARALGNISAPTVNLWMNAYAYGRVAGLLEYKVPRPEYLHDPLRGQSGRWRRVPQIIIDQLEPLLKAGQFHRYVQVKMWLWEEHELILGTTGVRHLVERLGYRLGNDPKPALQPELPLGLVISESVGELSRQMGLHPLGGKAHLKLAMLRHMQSGDTVTVRKLTEVMGVGTNLLYRWIAAYKKGGMTTLLRQGLINPLNPDETYDRSQGGRPPTLPPALWGLLLNKLHSGQLKRKVDIQAWLKRDYDLDVSLNALSRLIRAMGARQYLKEQQPPRKTRSYAQSPNPRGLSTPRREHSPVGAGH